MKRFTFHLPKNPFFRKGLLFIFLALAGIIFGDIFTLISRPSTEDVLNQLFATRLMTQSLEVNGTQMTADIWELPSTSSPAALKRASGKALVIGRLVYVFSGDVGHAKGNCSYPTDFPTIPLSCDYVIDTGLMRAVNGTSTINPNQMMAQLTASAHADGWETVGPGVWRKAAEVLYARATETPTGSQVALVIQKEQ